MKIRSKDDLEDHLRKDLSWRKKEFTSISFMVKKASKDNVHILMRSAIVLLYAHWEGHIKHCAKTYLHYLNSKKLKYAQLTSNFLLIGLGSNYKGEGSIKKLDVQRYAYDFLSSSNSIFNVNPDYVIDTKSNLQFDTLLCILEQIGLDDYKAKIITKQNFIDATLLKNRNSIAHGNFLKNETVTDVYNEINGFLLEMIMDFNDSISQSIFNKSYFRANVR